MDPTGGIVAGAGAVLGGIFGGISAGADRAMAREAVERAIAELDGLNVPPAEQMTMIAQYLQSVGQLTPELEQEISQKDTELKGISVDPRTKEAQFRALDQLEELGQGGLRLSDQATLEKTLGDVSARSRGNREALNTSLKARGAYGSGAELAGKMIGESTDAGLAHEAGLDVAAQAQDRALQSIMAGGDLGGKLRGQDFEEQRSIAAAQDEIQRFNTANRADTVRRNVDRGNAAREFNLRNDQRISDENVGIRNTEQEYNKGLVRQEYLDRADLAKTRADARMGQATGARQDATANANRWGKISQGIGQVGATLATAGGTGNAGSGTKQPTTEADRLAAKYLRDEEEGRFV